MGGGSEVRVKLIEGGNTFVFEDRGPERLVRILELRNNYGGEDVL